MPKGCCYGKNNFYFFLEDILLFSLPESKELQDNVVMWWELTVRSLDWIPFFGTGLTSLWQNKIEKMIDTYLPPCLRNKIPCLSHFKLQTKMLPGVFSLNRCLLVPKPLPLFLTLSNYRAVCTGPARWGQ